MELLNQRVRTFVILIDTAKCPSTEIISLTLYHFFNPEMHHYYRFIQSLFIRFIQTVKFSFALHAFLISGPLHEVIFPFKSISFRISCSEFLLVVNSLFCLSENVFICLPSWHNSRLTIIFLPHIKDLTLGLVASCCCFGSGLSLAGLLSKAIHYFPLAT